MDSILFTVYPNIRLNKLSLHWQHPGYHNVALINYSIYRFQLDTQVVDLYDICVLVSHPPLFR
jgi:hypothetical protein